MRLSVGDLQEILGKIVLFLMIMTILILQRKWVLSNLGLRPEDISSILGFLYTSYYFFKKKILLDGIIYRWFLINLLGWLSGLLTFNPLLSDLSITLFFIKFLLPLIFYIIIRDNVINNGFEIKSYKLIIILVIIYEYIRIIFINENAYYGFSPKGYEDSPLSSGFYYIFIQIILIYITKKNNSVNIIFQLLIFILVIFTGSKLSILLSAFLLVSNFIKTDSSTKIGNIFIYSLFIILLLPYIMLIINFDKILILDSFVTRLQAFNYPFEVIIGRGNWHKLDWVSGPKSIIGGGFLLGHISENLNITFGMHYDNELIFRYVTSGFLGLFFFFEFIFFIYKKIIEQENFKMLIVFLGFGVAFMGGEILNLSLSSCVFFIFLGILFQKNNN